MWSYQLSTLTNEPCAMNAQPPTSKYFSWQAASFTISLDIEIITDFDFRLQLDQGSSVVLGDLSVIRSALTHPKCTLSHRDRKSVV